MPATDNDEHGIKLEKQSREIFCMPPKKRHLHMFQSMATISRPLNSPHGDSLPHHVISGSEAEYVENSHALPEETHPEKHFSKVNEEGSSSKQNPPVDNVHVFHEVSQPVNDGNDTITDNRKPNVNDENLDCGNKFPPEELNSQLVHTELSEHCMSGSMVASIPADNHTANQKENLVSQDGALSLHVRGDDCKANIVKLERLYICAMDVKERMVHMGLNCKMEELDESQLQSDRSNWDLNTMMDAWQGSPSAATEDRAECGKYGNTMRSIRDTKFKIHDGIASSGLSHTNDNLASALSPSINKLDRKVRVSNPIPIPNTSGLSLFIEPSTNAVGLNVSVCSSVKPEPYTDFGCEGRQESELTQSLLNGAVKPEPFVEVAKEHSSSPLPRNPEVDQDMTGVSAANSETMDPVSLGGIGSIGKETSFVPSAHGSGSDRSSPHAEFVSDCLPADQNDHESADLVPVFPPANQSAHSSDHCSYEAQLSLGHNALQVTPTSIGSISEPNKLQGLDNSYIVANLDSSYLVTSSCTVNDSGTSEAVEEMGFHTNNTSLGCGLPNIVNSHLMGVVSPTVSKEESNICEEPDVVSEPPITVPSELKLPDQGASVSTANVSNFGCEPVLEDGVTAESNCPDNFAQKPLSNETSLLSDSASLDDSYLGTMENEVVATLVKPKLHVEEDDDIEDGEVRDLQVQKASSSSLRECKEIIEPCNSEPVKNFESVILPLPSLVSPEAEIIPQNQMENPPDITELAGMNVDTAEGSAAVQSSIFGEGSERQKSKSKALMTHKKISRDDSRKEKHNLTRQHGKSSSGIHKTAGGVGDAGSNVGEQKRGAKLQSSAGHLQKHILSEDVDEGGRQRSSSRNRASQMIPDSKDSAGIEKSTEKKHLSSRIERERSCDRSSRGDAPHRRGATRRDDNCTNDSRKVEYENKKEEASSGKTENDRGRGRSDRQLEPLRGDRKTDVDYSERFGRSYNYRLLKSRNTSDAFPGADGIEIGRLSHRRRSPGARERHVNVGMPLSRGRPMRDSSPGRRADGTSDLVMVGREERFMQRMAGDVDPPAVADMNFSREDEFVQRGGSISPPLLRRVPPRLTRLGSPSSNRRARSPRQWSPQRSLDGFNMRREVIRGRSPPNIQVVRMRSPPHARDPFMEGGMPGRRCGSPPCIPRLRDDIRDVGSPREFEYIRGGMPIQRNVRRLRLIDGPVNGEEFFGLVHPRPRIHELLEDEALGGRRVAGERHGMIRPFRHRFGDPSDEEIDFEAEHEGPRPIRFRMGEEEEFPDRVHPRPGNIRSRLGELPRRLRTVEERDDGRPWHDADFDEARMKRRRF